MIRPMRLVDVVVPRGEASAAVRRLHAAGVVHLVPFRVPAGDEAGVFAGGAPTAGPAADTWRRRLDWLTDLASSLGARGAPAVLVAELWDLDERALDERLVPLEALRERVVALATERESAVAERSRVASCRRLYEHPADTAGLAVPPAYAAAAVVVPERGSAAISAAADELRALTVGRCAVVRTPVAAGLAAGILVYPGRLAGPVHAMLGRRRLDAIDIPPELAGLPPAAAIARLDLDRARLDARIGEIERALATLRESHGALAAAARFVVGDRLAETAALPGAGASDHLVIFSGWVPADRIADLRSALGPRSAVTERRPTREELTRAPVAFDNPRQLRPFEPLASFVGVPRYGSLDPTPLLAFAFPLFVGFMVGDAGYGLLLLGLLLVARRRWRGAALLAAVWPVAAVAAVSTIAFGVLFGEWFGETGRSLGLMPIWLDRRAAAGDLLVLAIGVGVAQVGLGLALGAVNGVLLGERGEVASRLAELAGLIGLVGVCVAAAVTVPGAVVATCGALLAAGCITLLAVRRFTAPVELLGIVGNVLSYARLMAIALASATLGSVANGLGAIAGNPVAGLLVAGALHGLNFTLGFFDATVQGLRLQYVEFFTKFVTPGHVRYAPFAPAAGRGSRAPGQ